MDGIEYDTSQTGLAAVLKDWQIETMQVLWQNPEGLNSRTVWQRVNPMLKGKSISRASVINFLEAMHSLGILDAEDRTGKGGHHSIYRAALDETGYKQFIASTLIESLMQGFPDETKEALKNINP
jgi:predicted transcriptional regulator